MEPEDASTSSQEPAVDPIPSNIDAVHILNRNLFQVPFKIMPSLRAAHASQAKHTFLVSPMRATYFAYHPHSIHRPINIYWWAQSMKFTVQFTSESCFFLSLRSKYLKGTLLWHAQYISFPWGETSDFTSTQNM
jgi:hypothetical protein